MSYYSKRKKMEKEFDWMEMHCLEAGMSVEAIEEIHRMLLDEVNNDRKYYRHNQSLDAATFSDEEELDESYSPLYKRYLERFSVQQCEISEWGFEDWIEDLDRTEIILWVKKITDKDKEILTYIMEGRLQKQEIADILGCSPSAISKHLKQMRKELGEIQKQD
ncbi:hypothetical protein C806_03026 [Lachnospiraceae bacterium 3-1]|nr:hypothetical protein C806_03026 [Lachnospiraceae bacterium 3-1]